MNEGVQTLTAEADSLDQAISEIRGITEAAAGSTETISAAAQQQLASVEEIASSTADLSRQADELQQLVGRFKLYPGNQAPAAPEAVKPGESLLGNSRIHEAEYAVWSFLLPHFASILVSNNTG